MRARVLVLAAALMVGLLAYVVFFRLDGATAAAPFNAGFPAGVI